MDKFTKLIQVYDKLENINVLNVPHNDAFKKYKYPQLFYSGMGEEFVEKQEFDKINFDLNSETLYCYVLEPFGSFDNFLGKTNHSNQKGVFYKLSNKVLDTLRNKENFFLMIDSKHEGGWYDDYLIQIKLQLRELKIPINKLILLATHNWYVKSKDLNITERFTFGVPFNVVSFPTFILHKSQEMLKLNQYNNLDLKKYLSDKREYKFLNYNHRILKRQRIGLLFLMFKDNMFTDNLISFNFDFLEEKEQVKNLKYLDIASPEYEPLRNLISEDDWNIHFPKLLELNKNIVDSENPEELSGFGYEFPETYKKSYVSIVNESFFYERDDIRVVTEKSFKPFLHFHPFIVVGSPGTLSELKKWGFKTFDKWWDESYDDEIDAGTRFTKCYELIKKINNMSLDELHTMYLKMIPTLMHNFNLMKEYGKNIKDNYNLYYDKEILREVNENNKKYN